MIISEFLSFLQVKRKVEPGFKNQSRSPWLMFVNQRNVGLTKYFLVTRLKVDRELWVKRRVHSNFECCLDKSYQATKAPKLTILAQIALKMANLRTLVMW